MKYVYEERFVLPRLAFSRDILGYEIFRDEGLVKCFSCEKKEFRWYDLNKWVIPDNAREMEFLKMDFHGDYRVGAPVFYDGWGDLLKIGNH